MGSTNFREISSDEKQLLQHLLNIDFPGRDAIQEQVGNSLVAEIDENGSLEFKSKIGIKANVKKRIPIEAEFEDIDGVRVHLLLHVVNGVVKELEIYKDDGSPIIKIPETEKIRIIEYG
jgi:hypothetical protein